MKKYYLLLFGTFLSAVAFAQTTPGGLFQANGSSPLRLWLVANNYNATNGVWSDASGYGHHFVTSGGTQPTLQANISNAQSAVRLNNATHHFLNPTLGQDFNANDWTVYTVFRGSGNAAKPILAWGDFATASERTIGSFFDGEPQEGGIRLGDAFVSVSGVDVMKTNAVFMGVRRAMGDISVRIDGGTPTLGMPDLSGFTNAEMYIGRDVEGNSNAVATDLHEIIMYQSALSGLQRILVENYLGAKYNIPLPTDDYYTQTTPSTYQYEVVGIGTYASEKQAVALSGGLQISEQNNSLDAGSEFVFWGHNNQAHGDVFANLPGTVFDRWNRDFYVQKTGTVDVELRFLKSAATLAGNQYVLLYRANPSATFDIVTAASSGVDDGTHIIFTVPNSVFVSGYYTLGNKASSPQPITLYSLGSGGAWNNPTSWTLNPNGTTADNPASYIPDINKGAIILPAATITVAGDFTSAAFVTVNGVLDLVATTNHTYTKIGGNGRIRLGSGNFPVHTDMNEFVTSTGGTVEYYGSSSYTIGSLAQYNHLEITGGGVKTLNVNINLNGNFLIGTGTTVNSNSKDISLRGNWTNQGFYNSSANTITFTNVEQNQQIVGATTMNNVVLAKAASRNVELSNSLTVNGNLTLTNGSLVLNESNLTILGNILGSFSTANMIVQNGEGVSGQSLLYVSKGSAGAYQMIYPVGTPNNYSPVEIVSLSGSLGFLTVGVENYNLSGANILKRIWRIGTSGNGVTDAKLRFSHRPSDKLGSPNAMIHSLGGVPTEVSPSTISGTSFENTGANNKFEGTWTLATTPQVYYSRASGDWGTAATWSTASCGGAAATSVPTAVDFVIICNAHTVSLAANFTTVSQVSVQAGGVLNLGTTQGHSFGIIDGGGTIRLSSGNFPHHSNMSGFANSSTAKVIYEGGTYSLSNLATQPNTYPNVEFSGGGTKTLPSDNITVKGNLNIGVGTTLDDNGRNILIAGDWQNSGNFVASSPSGAIGQVIFNNVNANQNIVGATTFNRLEIAKSAGRNVILQSAITVKNTVILSLGNIVLGTHNMTLENDANFAHAFNSKFTSVGMIEQNNAAGGVGSGKLIIKRNSAAGFSNTIFPVGSAGRYSPFDVVGFTGTGSGQIEVVTFHKDFGTNGIGENKDDNGYVDRAWLVSSSGFTALSNVRLRFEFDALDKDGKPYVAKVDPAGTPPVTVPNGWYYDDGVRAFGVSLVGNDYLDGEWFLAPAAFTANTYYTSYVGEFGNFINWTTNTNGVSATGAAAPDRPPLGYPQPTDNIVLLPGASITATNAGTPMHGLQVASTLIRAGATLDLGTAINVKLGEVKRHTDGSAGVIKTAVALPQHGAGTDFTAFVSAGAGTFEFNHTADFVVPTVFITTAGSVNTYNNLILNLQGGNCTNRIATLKNDLLLNGFLSVTQGQLRINDNTTTNTRYTLDVRGDTFVGTSGCIGVGTANTHTQGLTGTPCGELPYPYGPYWDMYHKVFLHGNLTNKGKIVLSNHPAPVYRENCLNGAASLFMVGAPSSPNVRMDIEGQTDLQQIVIDKGINKSIEVLLTSNAYPNFRIFGRNDLGPGGYIDFPNGGGNNMDDVLVRKALWVRAGTLRLKGNVFIPSLTEPNGNTNPCGVINSDYLLATNGVIWLDDDFVTVRSGANAAVDTNPGNVLGVTGRLDVANTLAASPTWATTGSTAFSVNGLLRVSKGRFIAGAGAGIVMRAEGGEAALLIEGGFLETSLIRSSVTGAGRSSYTQTGGTVIIDEAPTNEYGSFGALSMSYPNSLFVMSGGDIIIRHVHTGSAAHTQTPPGGTYRRATAIDIQSAPGNFNVTGGTVTLELGKTQNNNRYEIGSTAPFWNLHIVKTQNTPAKAWVRYRPLTVLNELRITSNPAFGNAAILEANSPAAATDLANGVPTSFDVIVGGDMILDGGQYIPGTDRRTIFNGFSTVTAVAGIQTITNNSVGGGHNYSPIFENFVVATTQTGVQLAGTSNNTFIVRKDLYLTLGTLNDGGKTMQAQRDIYNDTQHLGSGKIVLSGMVANTPHNIYGNGKGIFANLELNESNTARNAILRADQTITSSLILTNGIFDIDRFNLAMTTAATFAGGTFNNTRMIRTRGFQSDGGVTKGFSNAVSYPFTVPIGSRIGATNHYTPYVIQSLSATTFGNITVRPANVKHPLTTSNNALGWYWKLNSSGFTGQQIIHRFDYPTVPSFPVSTGTVEDNYVNGYINYSLGFVGVPTWETGSAAAVNHAARQITFDYSASTGRLIDGDYTAGQMIDGTPSERAFNVFNTFYSRQSGNWNDHNTWSLSGTDKHSGPAVTAGTKPTPGTVAFITTGHTVTLTQNEACGAILIRNGAILDLRNFAGTNLGVVFGEGADELGTIRQFGTAFPGGDLGYFQSDVGGTYEYYTNGANLTFPTSSIATYRHLVINPEATRTITFPNQNLKIHEDLTIKGAGQAHLATTADGNLEVERNLLVSGSATFQYRPSLTVARFVTVSGDVEVSNGATFDVAELAGSQNHRLTLRRSLIVNGTADFSKTNGKVFTEFISATNAQISGSGSIDFERIIVNKGIEGATASLDDTLNVLEANATTLTLSGNAATDNTLTLNNKPFQLYRGTFRLNSATANWVINSRNGYANASPPNALDLVQVFDIPQSAVLWISQGTIRNTANQWGGGLFLNGKLRISGGSYIAEAVTTTNANHFIEPKATGFSAIEVYGGTLRLGGQIRRSPQSPAGALRYTQSAGTVELGTQRTPDATRGVFEILNTGSAFIMSGGDLYIGRSAGALAITDFYAAPSFSSVSGGTVHFGSTATPNTTQKNMTIQSSVPLWNVTVNSTNSPSVRMVAQNLNLQNNLTINNNATFNANNLSIYIGGDLTNNAAAANYQNSDTTAFNGTRRNQLIVGNISGFKNLLIDNNFVNGASQGTVTLQSGNITISNFLNLRSGIFRDNGNIINLQGDAYNGSVHESSANGKIVFNRVGSLQLMNGSGAGIYGTVEINNAANVFMFAPHTINGNLILSNGFLDIDNHELTFGTVSQVLGTLSNTRMVRTNGSPSVGGIKKNFAAGHFGFLFPLGVRSSPDKYTPAYLTNNNSASNAGSLVVRAVAGAHPLTTDPATTELQHYWRVTNIVGLTPVSVKKYFIYDQMDVRGDESQYIAGWLSPLTSRWESGTVKVGSLLPVPNFITVDGGTVVANGGVTTIAGDYTAGYPQEFLAIDTFKSVKTGTWDDISVWDRVEVPKFGSVVQIQAGHTVTATTNRYNLYALDIKENGVLDLASTSLHEIQFIEGKGTLKSTFSNLPLGDYSKFVAAGGGTIEYSGTVGFVLAGINTYNNLRISNSDATNGIVMANTNLRLNGSLIINAGSKLDNKFGKNITLAGDWTNNGAFVNTERGSIVTFNGTTNQTLGGATVTDFRRLAIDKNFGRVLVNQIANVSEYLTLKQGVFDVNYSSRIFINNIASEVADPGNPTSFVRGLLCKLGKADFTFPIGDSRWARLKISDMLNGADNTIFCSDYFVLDHNSTNPRTGVAYPSTPTATKLAVPLKVVSTSEYWHVLRDVDDNNDARVKVTQFYEQTPQYIKFQGHYYDSAGTGIKWHAEPSTFISAGEGATVGVLVSNSQWFNNGPTTNADDEQPLPVSLLSFGAKARNNKAVDLHWEVVNEIQMLRYVVERSVDGVNFRPILEVLPHKNNRYEAVDNEPVAGLSYYRLRAEGLMANDLTYSRMVAVRIGMGELQQRMRLYPNPSVGDLSLELRGYVGEVEISLIDLMGQTHGSLKLQGNGGEQIESLGRILLGMPNGVYLLRCQNAGRVETHKVVLSK